MLIESKSEPTLVADPWMLYLYAMRSPATKEKYLMRLGKFLEFLHLQGTLEDRARFFARKGKYDSAWAFNCILEFLQTQKEYFHAVGNVTREGKPILLGSVIYSTNSSGELAIINNVISFFRVEVDAYGNFLSIERELK
jgi:hypothetical protein